MRCPLSEAAERWPDAPAIAAPEETLSYADYDAVVSGVTERLQAEGLRSGQRIGIVMQPSANYLLLLMGCFRAGIVACPLSPRLPEAGLRAAMERTGCERLLNENVRFDRRRPPNRSQSVVDPNAPAVVVFTSGSSGEPKAAVLSYGNLHHNALASNRNIPLEPDDRWLLSLPLYHVSGLGIVFRCLTAGATVVVPLPEERLEESLDDHRITHVSLVTTQLLRLLEQAESSERLSRMKAVLLGGSGLPPSLIRSALDAGVPIHTSYGLTEMASQVATTAPGTVNPEQFRWATPLFRDAVRVDEGGEILVAGPTLFLGYLNGERILRPLTDDGWFRTGDLGTLDNEGRLRVLGRKDNMFISGGENIQPEEIERELGRVEGVAQSIVVPVDHAEYGRRPVAFVRTTSGDAPDGTALRAALELSLPRFKIPDVFLAWPHHLDRGDAKPNRAKFTEEARLILPS